MGRIRTCGAPAPRRSTSFPTTTGGRFARWLWSSPSSKASFDGFSLRVPTPTVSIVDFVVETERGGTVEEINAAFQEAAETEALQGILGYTDEPLVSSDFRQDSRSAIVDGLSTMVIETEFDEGHRLVRQRVGVLLPGR